MKVFARWKIAAATKLLAVVVGLAAFGGSAAASIVAPPVAAALQRAVVPADWQEPLALPRRFRNHCSIDTFTRRPYCSDHCGFEYQFYFCSPHSFGCCRIGFGYCDWSGLLRCHP